MARFLASSWLRTGASTTTSWRPPAALSAASGPLCPSAEFCPPGRSFAVAVNSIGSAFTGSQPCTVSLLTWSEIVMVGVKSMRLGTRPAGCAVGPVASPGL